MTEILNFLTLSGGMFLMTSHSPYFSALGLVLSIMGFSSLLIFQALVFIGLVLLLMYLGGMMVVFAFTAALATDDYPEGSNGTLFATSLLMTLYLTTKTETPPPKSKILTLTYQEDLLMTSDLYQHLSFGLLLGGFGLLLCLLVILYLVQKNGTIRKI